MSVPDHRAVHEAYRQAAGPVAADSFLCEVGARHASHAFLAGNTQLVYLRIASFIAALGGHLRAGLPHALQVLDWGCGKGHMTYLMRRAGFDVVSCDRRVAADDSAFGQATPIIAAQGIDVVPLDHDTLLPFADGSFDMALSTGVLEHVADDAGSLKELRRVLRPGGLLVVTFLPYTLSWTQRLAHARGNFYHPRLYSRHGLRELGHAAGFDLLLLEHGQLLPKNSVSMRLGRLLEPLDLFLCRHTPLRYFATNLEAVLLAR